MSTVLAPRRLPGLRVDVAAQPAVEALPRMDIAVFVGFASTGPLHLPVAIESATQYAEVFGPDAPLAWDVGRGERVYAHLGAAVRAFFSNGGRRCWVIRVARIDAAVANRFGIPGVLEVGPGYEAHAAMAGARCEGSWSDTLRVWSALSKQSIGVDTMTPIASPAAPPPGERYQLRTRARLQPGDLLEFGDAESISAYAVVDAVSTVQSGAEGAYVVDLTVCAAFERLGAGSPPSWPLPAPSAVAEVPGFGRVAASFGPSPDAGRGTGRLKFDQPMPPTLAAGAWARWWDGGETVWLRMDSIERRLAAGGSPPTSDVSTIDASADGPAWRDLGASLQIPLESIQQASVLTLDLRVADAAERAFRLSGVGLTRQHPAAWWNQRTDAEHYKAGARASEGPRFPLAAEHGAPHAWIPLGVEPLFGAAAAPLPQQASALERDGLARFDRELFLDPELAATGAASLLEHADNIRFLRASPREQLQGIHGALSVGRGGLFNEATLLVIPDAVHAGWEKRPAVAADRLAAEVLTRAPKAPARPAHWSRHRGACVQPSVPPKEAEPADAAPAVDAFEPDFGVFLDCRTRKLAAPTLFGPAAPVSSGGYRLHWTSSEPDATYVLHEARRADFKDAREVYRERGLEYVVALQREGVYYYQVTAELGDERSEGSLPIAVIVREDDWFALPTNEFADAGEPGLLAVHRAALRLAAASGELLVVLALPRHYRAAEAARYADRLRIVQAPSASDPDALSHGERRALSYGALYHPWIASGARVSGGADAIRIVPPDGFAAGVLALRASARGAWIAPANETFKDAVALTPPIQEAEWQALQDAQINIVRQDPRGFLAMSADTLAHAEDVDLRPINVRRLLILLRRLAVRRGISYVFEPNGPQLRRAVQRGFTLLLTDLFRRGAFAGPTVAESFRVVADDTINTPRIVVAGRFIVELRVAPSVPMRFLSILLAQTGERLTVAEEL